MGNDRSSGQAPAIGAGPAQARSHPPAGRTGPCPCGHPRPPRGGPEDRRPAQLRCRRRAGAGGGQDAAAPVEDRWPAQREPPKPERSGAGGTGPVEERDQMRDIYPQELRQAAGRRRSEKGRDPNMRLHVTWPLKGSKGAMTRISETYSNLKRVSVPDSNMSFGSSLNSIERPHHLGRATGS
jgi:hypothetical protein